MMASWLLITALDTTLGRVNRNDITQQSRLELLIEDLLDKSRFHDKDGFYKDVCEWDGVTLDVENLVVGILWASMNTAFFPQGGSLDLQWIPETAVSFTVYKAGIAGNFDVKYLPRHIQLFDLAQNTFTGDVDLTHLPSTVRGIFLGNNCLTGTLDFTMLPLSLRKLYLQENQFTGSINLIGLTDTIEELSVAGNQLSGTLNLSELPNSMQVLILEENKFKGSLRIKLSEHIQIVILKKNNFFGTVVVDGTPEAQFFVDGRDTAISSFVSEHGVAIDDDRFQL